MAEDSQIKVLSVVKKTNNSGCIVTLDNEAIFVCSSDLVLKFTLTKDKIITEETLSEIKSQNRLYQVKQSAFNFASYKPRSIKQVTSKLKDKGFSQNEIDLAVMFLKEFNLLNDENYAKMLINEFVNRKRAGEGRIYNELLKRGIDKELAKVSLNKYFPHEENFELAYESAQKKLRAISHKPKEKQRSALIGHLQRYGYDWDIIKQVIKKILDNEIN